MDFYDSELSVLKITDTGGELRDLSAYVVNITPHFGNKMHDKTTLGQTHEQTFKGIGQTSIDVELLYSEDALVGTDTVLGPLLDDVTARTWEYWPRGASGKKYTGTSLIENYQPKTAVGSLVGATFTLRANSRSRV
ncbi:MAG: hypothetical protein WC329_01660 [Candidatus Omnitrophota bacterium]|jgi:hypothetical protein